VFGWMAERGGLFKLLNKMDTPVTTKMARFHLGAEPCRACNGSKRVGASACLVCYQTGRHPRSGGWMTALKRAMGVTGNNVFVKQCISYLAKHSDFNTTNLFHGANRSWLISVRDGGALRTHKIRATNCEQRGSKVLAGRIEIEFAGEVIEVRSGKAHSAV